MKNGEKAAYQQGETEGNENYLTFSDKMSDIFYDLSHVSVQLIQPVIIRISALHRFDLISARKRRNYSTNNSLFKLLQMLLQQYFDCCQPLLLFRLVASTRG